MYLFFCTDIVWGDFHEVVQFLSISWPGLWGARTCTATFIPFRLFTGILEEIVHALLVRVGKETIACQKSENQNYCKYYWEKSMPGWSNLECGTVKGLVGGLRQDPLDLSFWSFLTFLHHGIEKVERHLLWKFHDKIQRKSWSNVPPNLLACIGFLYKVVHKNGHLRKFNRSREIEFNFFTAWTIFMKLGTLIHHVHGYKNCLRFFNFCLGT